jgi:hypothetical protein
MTRWLCFVLATAALVGCSKSSPDNKGDSKPESTPPVSKNPPVSEQPLKKEPPETKLVPKDPKTAVKTAQEAREELQARIDRCLGGQSLNDLFGGTIGIWAVGKKIQSMELVRVVQKYDTEGKIVPNQFVAAIKCVAAHSITGERESREFAIHDFTFRDGAWQSPFLR